MPTRDKVPRKPTSYPDETAGSWVWRVAKAQGLSVAELCQWGLNMPYHETRGDLDHILCQRPASRMVSLGVATRQQLKGFAIEPEYRISAYCPQTRRCNRPIKLCPECMNQSAYGRRFWRTLFAEACPIHGCVLIDHCPRCGHPISYQGCGIGPTPSLWLESWPRCIGCFRFIEPTPLPAAPALVRLSRQWETALRGKKPRGWSTATQWLGLSATLIHRFRSEPRYAALLEYLANGSCTPQAATAMLLEPLITGPRQRSMFYAALSMAFETDQLVKEIQHCGGCS